MLHVVLPPRARLMIQWCIKKRICTSGLAYNLVCRRKGVGGEIEEVSLCMVLWGSIEGP